MNKTHLAILGAVTVVVAAAAGYSYYESRLRDVPPPPELTPRQIHARAGIIFAPQPAGSSASPTAGSEAARVQGGEPTSPAEQPPRFEISGDPLQALQRDWNEKILRDVGPAFPDLSGVLGVPRNGESDAAYRGTAYALVDAAEKAPAEQRPELLFAADEVAQEIGCLDEDKAGCQLLREELARHQFTLKGDALGGVFVYGHDLLWRIWRDYPQTEWGERAFVILLDHGWDTSPTCQGGMEQFRVVIRRGEELLAQRPNSAQREAVALLVGEAYATWWSLSKETRDGMSDYVDAKRYQEGAESARAKAIDYFQEIAGSAAATSAKEYARQMVEALRDKEVLDNYKFYCVYD